VAQHFTHRGIPAVEVSQYGDGEAGLTAAPGSEAINREVETRQLAERAGKDGGPLAAGGCVGGSYHENTERNAWGGRMRSVYERRVV
jgi:hypothetical protein